jgi:DNA gyrase subunit A
MTEAISIINIEDELKSSFLDYSMSVIVSRALPDVRDGLKPVHRRILYAMHELKNHHNRPYLKSARIVGDVIGRFHPHGDSAVYDALVRMAQEFSMRYPLVDGQGNFGSIDGDSPAAMRYTEVRLELVSDLLLADIDRGTVNFGPNYDNKEFEPLVLPTQFPQLLANGASGIAVGMATNIPPHNLSEIVDALLALIDNPKMTIDELMVHLKGPDFPTYGGIIGLAGIKQAYHTGRGSITIRGKAEVVESKSGKQSIIITEIPYQVNKAKFIERIAELVRDKKIEGISDLRDESAKEDIRVVIELKKGEIADVILNNLYKQTPLQTTFGVNMVALQKGAPRLMNIKDILEAFYEHRREVILRKTAHDLRKAEEKAHILLGLKKAVENVDEIVSLIKKATDSQSAQLQIMERFELSEIQAKAILEMRLSRLTGLERDKIVADYKDVMVLILDLQDILDKPERVTKIIIDELNDLKTKHSDERRTQLLAAEGEFTMESLVADEEVVVSITHGGYIKRTPLDMVKAQRRGGKGRQGMKTKEEDVVKALFVTSNHQSLLCFTNLGRVYDIKVYEIPEVDLPGKGKHFANLIRLQAEEKVVSTLSIREFVEGSYIVSVTKCGYIKKTELMSYKNLRQSGIVALKLDDGDELIKCDLTGGKDEILIATRLGKAIRFSEDDIRPMGRAARGVCGIKFSEEEDKVIGLEVVASGDGDILSVCENGYGKRTPLEEYRLQSRGGKGIYTIKVTERNGPVVGIMQVSNKDDLVVMTSSGKVTRFNLGEVGVVGRVTQGVRLMSVADDEVVTGFARVDEIVEGEPESSDPT